jgi:hypothetical protein
LRAIWGHNSTKQKFALLARHNVVTKVQAGPKMQVMHLNHLLESRNV